MKLTWRENLLQFFSKNTNQFVTHFLISYSFLDNYIETSGQRVSNRDLSHFSISHLFVNILLKYQYVTHFSITIYRPWVKGFERGICREVGQWEVSRGQSQSLGSQKVQSRQSIINESRQSMTKEHHLRVSSKHHQRASPKSIIKESRQRVSSKSPVSTITN